MNNKKILLTIMIIVVISIVLGTAEQIYTFTTGNSEENLTLTGGDYTSLFIDMAINSSFTKVQLQLTPLVDNTFNYSFYNESLLAYYPFEGSWLNEITDSIDLYVNNYGNETYAPGKVGANCSNHTATLQLYNDTYNDIGPKVYSVELWIKPEVLGTNARIINFESGAGTNTELRIYPNGSLYSPFRTDIYTGFDPRTLASTQTLNVGEWYHVVLTSGVGGYRMYINGEFETKLTETDQMSESSFRVFHIGGENGGNAFRGYIDNILLSNTTYTDALVNFTYNSFNGVNFSSVYNPAYPSSFRIEVGDLNNNPEYNQNGSLYTPINISLTDSAQEVLNSGCACTNCSNLGDYCRMPFSFYSGIASSLNVILENITYSYTLNITIRDADTNSLVTNNISARFISDTDEQTYYTTTGTLSREDITTGEYEIFFSDTGTDYSSRTYTITMANGNQNLNAYLEKNTSTVTFTVADRSSSELLEGVLGTMYRYINGSYAVIESKTTDVTGRIVFSYQSNINYRFLFTKSNYDNYLFTLNPVLFNEYDIKMDPVARINYSMDYDRVSIAYGPTLFYEGANNFTYIISSPYGELDTYSFSLTYPGGSTGNSGSNALGETFTPTFIITGATSSDTVRFDYNYTLDLSDVRTFTYYFPIAINGSNQTMVGILDNTYGLGIGERLIIAVLGAIFIVGIAFLIGRPMPGLALGLFWFGILVYIGFIPWWSVAITILAGVIFIGLRGEV